MASSLRWFVVSAELGEPAAVRAAYHVVSENAARARFESDFGMLSEDCVEMTPMQAIEFANRQDAGHERTHDNGDDCEWCAQGIPH